MSKFVFLLILFISFNSFGRNVEIPVGSAKNIKFNKPIESCFQIYNKINIVCSQNSILLKGDNYSNHDKIIVIFKDGSQEIVNTKRSLGFQREKVKNRINQYKDDVETFSLNYSHSYSEFHGINGNKTLRRKEYLSFTNKFNKLIWNVKMSRYFNSNVSDGDTRIFYNTTLWYENFKLYYGDLSSMPLEGTRYMTTRLYGFEGLYRSRDYFIDLRTGEEGIQYLRTNNRINSASVGSKFKRLKFAFSYGENLDEDITVSGLNTSYSNEKFSSNLIFNNSKNEERDVKNYQFKLGIRRILKTSLFDWRSISFTGDINPNGSLYLGGNNIENKRNIYNLSNRFQIFVPEKYGKLFYTNSLRRQEFGNFLNTDYYTHSLDYQLNNFTYGFNYLESSGGRFDLRSIGHTAGYTKKNGDTSHIFSIGVNSRQSNNVISHSTGVGYTYKKPQFVFSNTLTAQRQEVGFNESRNYILRNKISFKDYLSLDKLSIGANSYYREDEVGNLYNNLNRFNVGLTKIFNKNHSVTLNSFYGYNNTYDGKEEFKGFSLQYNFKFKKKHEVVSSLLYKRNKDVVLYNDKNINNKIDEEDPVLKENVYVEVYDENSKKVHEQEVVDGKFSFDLDKRKRYYASLKDSTYKIMDTDFKYESSDNLIVQNFVENFIIIRDIENEQYVDTSLITVRCSSGYSTSSSATFIDRQYKVKYPKDDSCIISFKSSVDEVYHDIEYDEVLPNKRVEYISIKLKRYNKIHGILKIKGKEIANKTIRLKNLKTKTDDFGYFEFVLDGPVKYDYLNDFYNKNRIIKNNCKYEYNGLFFTDTYYDEYEINLICR